MALYTRPGRFLFKPGMYDYWFGGLSQTSSVRLLVWGEPFKPVMCDYWPGILVQSPASAHKTTHAGRVGQQPRRRKSPNMSITSCSNKLHYIDCVVCHIGATLAKQHQHKRICGSHTRLQIYYTTPSVSKTFILSRELHCNCVLLHVRVANLFAEGMEQAITYAWPTKTRLSIYAFCLA